ncbi:transmembrane protein 30A [Capsaspora owczarzaki ATCC 30864]|uniref:Transmembrane protein 30A n=1 Tax=Capsaspora owczarzaki (strain ATCC 30864) TaxID=595528 RepID=A0A0D2UCW4_CAPO3|nr:transmembrane protein 30A [Capsaspora owczarzaki ATCC 30864]KJE92906.1 transmembrane protein 30A [Capsaspora owczarzaki ATCC 30864]|eukprot:XP_004363516.2 transmembrane protein 30A [Capsaspora owczarzaki ATCC 30864]
MADAAMSQSRKPGGSAFKQQRLPAWQPVLTPKSVIPVFLIIGIVFIPLGIGFLVSSNGVKEVEVDYTDCQGIGPWAGQTCAEVAADWHNSGCQCQIQVTIDEDFDSTTYMYYGLTNYYQNHRRYVKSRDDAQLHGLSPLLTDCDPLDTGLNANNQSTTMAPCGLIANSLFNDTITLFELGSTTVPYAVTATGIAWSSDVDTKFSNPSSFANTVKPPNWPANVTTYLSSSNPVHPNGEAYENEDFIVWMRTAALPNFRKLYRILDAPLAAGTYDITIDYRYPVAVFSGNKKIIFSTTSWLGGKNPFLGIAYIVIGSLNLIFGLAFLARHCIAPRALGDSAYLKWAAPTANN